MSGKKQVTVAEAVAAVNALVEKSKVADPNEGRTVVGMYLSPRGRDGSGGEVEKVIRTGPREARQYMPTVPYWNEPRLTDGKRRELEAEANGIRAQLKSPGLTPAQKIRLEQALIHIERILGKTDSGDAVDPQYR